MRFYLKNVFLLTILFFLTSKTVAEETTTKFIKSCLVEINKTPSPVPKSVRIAQAILESDRGKSPLCKETNNYYGLRLPIYKYSYKKIDGKTIKIRTITGYRYETFRDKTECFQAHVNRLKNNPVYKNCFKSKNAEQWAYRLKDAGYCPDKDYADQLINLMERYNLKKLDVPSFKNFYKKTYRNFYKVWNFNSNIV